MKKMPKALYLGLLVFLLVLAARDGTTSAPPLESKATFARIDCVWVIPSSNSLEPPKEYVFSLSVPDTKYTEKMRLVKFVPLTGMKGESGFRNLVLVRSAKK